MRGLSLQQRHFNFIANQIACLALPTAQRNGVAMHFANALKHTNPKFNRERFLAACGYCMPSSILEIEPEVIAPFDTPFDIENAAIKKAMLEALK